MFGARLLATALFLILLGLFVVTASSFLIIYSEAERNAVTAERSAEIRNALIDFYTIKGRYPCPARLDSPIDTPSFGIEAAECDTASPGLFVDAGFTTHSVATGFVPVRSLGLSDETALDGWNKRIAYTISTGYTVANSDEVEAIAEIKIEDQNGHNVTAEEGNIVFSLTAFKDVDQGAFSAMGVPVEPCPAAGAMANICNFSNTFVRSNRTSEAEPQNRNMVDISYYAGTSCNLEGNIPTDVGFLLDTSGSMAQSASCPPGRSGNCNRMDLALWALHRAMSARMHQIRNHDDMTTGYSPFTGHNTGLAARNAMQDRFFMNEDTDIENEIYKACPSGMTPLGAHIEALSGLIKEGEEDKPNVITVLSDGLSNRGIDPVTVAKNLANGRPHTKVNIIDVGNNPTLRQVAELTGGDYFQTSNPDELLEALYASIGLCNEESFPAITDGRQCSP